MQTATTGTTTTTTSTVRTMTASDNMHAKPAIGNGAGSGGSGGGNISAASAQEQDALAAELQRLRLESAQLRAENERLRASASASGSAVAATAPLPKEDGALDGLDKSIVAVQLTSNQGMNNRNGAGGDQREAEKDTPCDGNHIDDDDDSMNSQDAEDAVMKAILSNGALSAMVQSVDGENSVASGSRGGGSRGKGSRDAQQQQQQQPQSLSSDYVDFASYPTGHRYGGLFSDKGSVSARANFAPQLETELTGADEASSPAGSSGGGNSPNQPKKKTRMPSILRRSSYRSTSNSQIGSAGSFGTGSSMRSIGMTIDSESDADSRSVASAASRSSKGSKGSASSSGGSGFRRNTVHIGEVKRQLRNEQAQTRQLRLQSGGRAAAAALNTSKTTDPPRTTYPPRRSTRSSITILRTRGSVASETPRGSGAGTTSGANALRNVAQGVIVARRLQRSSVTSYDDLVDPTLALRRSDDKHGSAEILLIRKEEEEEEAHRQQEAPVAADVETSGHHSDGVLKLPERDLSGFRRTSVRSILTLDSDDDASLPSVDIEEMDDGHGKSSGSAFDHTKGEGAVVVSSSPPTDISLSRIASQPDIGFAAKEEKEAEEEEAPRQRPRVQRHASMDMSVVSVRSRRSSAVPLGGMHSSLETCNYDSSSFRSKSTALTRGGDDDEPAALGPGPEPPRGRAMKRMSQSMRRVSFSAHVDSLVDERLEMYISSMIGNTTHMHNVDEHLSFDKFALLSVKGATLSAPPPAEMSSGTDIDRFIHEGPRYLDSFFLDTADLLDEYPKKDVDGGNEADLDPMALSTFCFPDGLRVRVVPRGAMEGAKRLGWTGRMADRSHLLVFTDDKGETRNGIAITIRAETASSSWDKVDIIKSLNQRRIMRVASTKISRWYRKLKAARTTRISPSTTRISPSRGLAYSMSVRSDFGKRMPSSEGLSKPIRRVHSTEAFSTNSGGGTANSNANWGDMDSIATEKSGKSNISLQKRATRKMMKTLGLKKPKDRADSIGNASKSSNKKKSGLRKKVTRLTMDLSSGSRQVSDTGSVGVSEGDDEQTHHSVETYASKEKKPLSDWAKAKGKEAYDAMVKADSLGDVAIVEQCYVMVGGRADDQSILHNALQQLVNYEREEALLRFCGRKNGVLQEGRVRASPNSSGSRRPSLGDRNEVEQSYMDYTSRLVSRRHNNLKYIQAECKLSREQIAYCLKKNVDPLDELNGLSRRFEQQLPVRNSTKINLPLPLPKIGKEWGFAKLLLSIGPDSTLLALKLLLLERSILVLGDKSDEVTAACRALLRLIKPFKWASTFMPVLPFAMLDFVNSPVPFVAGMSVESEHALNLIEEDMRVVEAQTEGMSIINLTSGALLITSEPSVGDKLSLSSTLRKKIHSLHRRLSLLAENEDSALHSLEKFCTSGASPKERLTLQSASSSIEEYFGGLLGDVASGDGWLERYGKTDEASGQYLFKAEWMIEALRAELRFQEDLIHTQLFHAFVDSERSRAKEIEEARNGDTARFVADWLMFRWKRRKNQATTKEKHPLEEGECPWYYGE